MDSESKILAAVSDLESEVVRLIQRLDPITVGTIGVQSNASTQPAPSRSQVNARVVSMTEQLRDLQSRLEI